MTDMAARVLETFDRMLGQRGNFNTLWQSVSERVLPNYSDFTQQWSPGQRRTNRVFDSTAPMALGHGCAALESMLCPASTRWHGLRPRDPKLRNDIAIMQYLDSVTDVLFDARYSPSANFQSQVEEVFAQILAFGNGPMLVDDIMGYGLRYRVMHLAETYGMENAAGVIDTVYRQFELTCKAALDAEQRGMFDEGTLPDAIRSCTDQTKQFTFIHAVYPNEDAKRRATTYKDMAFSSCIVSKEYKCTLRESGYHTQPMLFARYRVNSKETYGRGPGVDVLPEILALNEMEKSDIRQTQRATEPPLLLADDGSLGAFDLRGNAMNYGGLSPEGKPLVVAFESGTNFQVLQEKLDQKRQVIERAFLVDIFSILTQQPQMTATEVLQRAQEKGQLLAPIIGRIQSELFGPLITRELDILHRAGALPPPPDKLKRMGGLDYEIVYESQVQQVQKQSKALAVNRVLQQLAPLMQIDENVAKVINPIRTARILTESNGAPADMMNTDDEMQAAAAQAADQNNMTNLAQIAGPASSAIKNLAQAQAAGGAATPGNLVGAMP